MITLFPFNELGRFKNDWLNARHHFSFGEWYDPSRMGFGPLRVWNDDTIKAGEGFPMHPHRDMEIITYVRTGAITHEDSMGNKGRTESGDVQVMSAGKGIFHSEYNHEPEDMTLFQIWIEPHTRGVPTRWEQQKFPKTPGSLKVLASGRSADKDSDALMIHQDAAILGGTLSAGQTIELPLKDRQAYLVPLGGRLEVEGKTINNRDGAFIKDLNVLTIKALDEVEVVLADLPVQYARA